MELRCDSRLHGVLRGDRFEVRCHSKACGKKAGVVVLHIFDIKTGKHLETQRFADPVNQKENNQCP